MRKIIVLFLIFTKILNAQESNDKVIYLDSLGVEVSKDNYFYKKVIKEFDLDKSEYKFYKYYQSGNLYQEGFIDKKVDGKFINEILIYDKKGNKENATFFVDGKPLGKVKKWYENGSLKEEGEFNNNSWESGLSYKVESFWDENNNKLVVDGNGLYKIIDKYISESGSLKNGYKDGIWKGESFVNKSNFTEIYKDGNFISGISEDKEGNRIDYVKLMIKPEPKNGMKDFYKFIGKNFRYSKEGEKLNVKGKIFVQFVVDKTGKIVEPKIIRSLGYGLDEEAIRVILKYENWIPGKLKGINVRVSYSIPISLQGVQ